MRRFAIVTTCSEAGWAEYGANMVRSVLAHFPAEVRIYLYVDFKVRLSHDRLVVRQIDEHCPDLVAFQNRLSALDFGRGERLAARGHEKGFDAEMIWNARKFSFKVFTVEHAVLGAADDDVVVWLDADSLAFDTVDQDLLESTAPIDLMLGYLGRSWKYSECGYVAYNQRHPMTDAFVRAVADMYRTGSIFSLKEWHDSYVFDVVRAHFEQRLGVQTHNISQGVGDLDHVFVNSELGRHIDHLKGGRKGEGRSRASDIKAHSDVAYWAAPEGTA